MTAPGEPATEHTAPRPLWRRVLLLAAVILGLTALIWNVGLTDVDEVRIWIAQAGVLAPALFIVLFALVTLAFAPKTALGIGAGVLFGFGTGFVVTVAGAVLGATCGFALARLLGREAVERWTGARVARADAFLRRRGFVGIVGARVIPLVPFSVVTYSAGLSAVRFVPFFFGTAVGTLPGSTVQAAIGAYGASPFSWQFAAAVGALVLFWITGALVARRYRNRHRAAEEH